jgi:hypothetical protein
MSTPILVITPSVPLSLCDAEATFRGCHRAPFVVHSSSREHLAQRFQGRRTKCLHQAFGCIHWRDKVGLLSVAFIYSELTQWSPGCSPAQLVDAEVPYVILGRFSRQIGRRFGSRAYPHPVQVTLSAVLYSGRHPNLWRRRRGLRSMLDCR